MESALKPWMDEWIQKMWHIYTMEIYSAMKMSEIMSFVGKWMELDSIVLSKENQAHKEKFCLCFLICRI
jgi:hypothetical protein